MSLRRASEVVPGSTSTIDYGRELTSPVESMVPERASVRGIGAALNRSAARTCHINSFSIHRSCHDTELHWPSPMLSLIFYGTFLVIAVMVSEDVLVAIIVIDESASVLQVKPFNGPDHLLICLSSKLLVQLSELLQRFS